jgi:thiol-disulfide isomerase/thioredoxin
MIIIRFKFRLTLLILSVLIFLQCAEKKILVADLVNEKLKTANKIEFTYVDTNKKGFSHDLDKQIIVGAYLPSFNVIDINGNQISSTKLKGKPTVINIWFSKCIPCLKEMPFLNNLKSKFNNVNFVSFSPDDNTEIERFLKTRQFEFDIVPNSGELIRRDFSLIWGYPVTLVLDKNHKIVMVTDSQIKSDSLRLYNTIENLL